ncbi:GntR family transcriptional regulator [Maribellus sp. YY47]|uniref:GntR family transcriptional regulator n=1 Tax=Maribellus sp. YY47 TaxID=2929486 RepID=UPI002001CE41|nr:GntR family transcriptional regulator [Maribellus sp. YY47]MCK3684908.1 GntR family transcriptional regulator [Maribellus sp. YY47]
MKLQSTQIAGGQTKLQQLVHSITEAIAKGELKAGDPLPSVNQLSSESGFSRDTVFKAYNILKQRSVVESAPTKGYFVANESYRVFVLLDDFSAFKEQLYQSLRQNLPESYAVDLLFHHYNREVFTQLIESSLGRYSMYVVMNIDHQSMEPILNKIDSNKLLLLDMGKPANDKVNYLLQDFGESVIHCLDEQADRFRKYNELVLVYSEKDTPHPGEVVPAIQSFCKKHSIIFSRVSRFDSSKLKSGQAYFVIRDSDLVEVIKSCRSNQLELGKQVGIISYNDTPMKEIVGGGITVISTDFEEMGREVATFVQHKHKIGKVLSTSLILRDSL